MSDAAYGGRDEFAAFLERYRIDRALIRRHWARLGLGLLATVLVVAYNGLHRHATAEVSFRVNVVGILCALHLALCILVLVVCWWRLSAQLKVRTNGLRDEVWKVASFAHRWGNVLLFLAATGHGVVVLGTLMGLNIFTADGRVLWLSLVPTLLVVIHGLLEVPTRERLVEIRRRAAAGRE